MFLWVDIETLQYYGFSLSSPRPLDYTPGVLELLESLMNPNKYDQDSLPWAYPASPGKTYRKMAAEMIESGAVPMGVFRYPHLESGARLPYGMCTRDLNRCCV